MTKIKVLLTGGTIGSEIENSIANVTNNASNSLFDSFRASRPNSAVKFDSEILFTILSENITLDHWQQLYNRINEIIDADYDGIVITHGTDTLAYTAAFLSLMFSGANIPVLLVSSNYPLSNKKTNGYENFNAAIDFILKVNLRGVYVPFFTNGKMTIHLGSRLLQAQSFSSYFMSFGDVWFGEFSNGIFRRNDNPHNPTIEEIQDSTHISLPLLRSIKNIFCITPYPGLDYSLISFAQNPVAVLHGLYHSGTACTATSDEKNSVLSFAQKCRQKGIDFYAAPFDSCYTLYHTSKSMNDIGIKFIKNMSIEAAYVKLTIAYSVFDNNDERQQFIEDNIAFEQLLPCFEKRKSN